MKAKNNVSSNARQSKNERIETFLRERYDFRFNTVKSRTEFRDKESDNTFSPLTKFDINSMRRLLDATVGVSTSGENIRSILESDFCPKVNPVQEYFLSLPQADENASSEIARLAECVTVVDSDKSAISLEMAYRCCS